MFTPTPNAAATCRISNNGGYTVYIGGSNVSPFNGFALPPGCRPVELQNCPLTVWTCSNVFQSGVTKVTNAAALPAGVTALSVTTSGLAVGPAILGFGGTGQEVVNITTVTSNTALTLSTPTLYDHGASCTIATAVAQPSNITVTAGVV